LRFIETLFLLAEYCNFILKGTAMKKNEKKNTKKDVIASRKACKTDGTGLSHYILMDKKTK
jgi:modified peptide precursor CbpA